MSFDPQEFRDQLFDPQEFRDQLEATVEGETTIELAGEVIEIEGPGLLDTLEALLHSRKVLLAAFGVAQTLVSHYFDIPAEVWASVDGLVLALIGAIAYEDAAEKSVK